MHQKLVISVFEKAKKELNSDVLTQQSTHISKKIQEDFDFAINERTLRNHYNDASNGIDIGVNKTIADYLAKYIGHNDFHDFNKSITKLGDVESRSNINKTNKIVAITGIIIVALFIIYNSVNKQRWMIWQQDHYVEVKFDSEKFSNGILKLYKEERIENFKKIPADCDTEFFNKDGTENMWYGKNQYGELEYFTSFGLHPETGKTLKRITKHMIRKHICNDF